MQQQEAIVTPRASLMSAGQVLGARYRVERPIACGGMGVVWAATHTELGHRVAIKLLAIEGSPVDAAATTRFRREARAGARLRSEHVCRVLDTGELDDGTPYLVMEYLEGRDVSDLLAARHRLSVLEASEIAYQACLGLIEAHATGIVHRDLKPSNLFLARQPDGTQTLKLLDFGISKNLLAAETPTQSLTQTATLLGSPLYMSPEQLNSARDVDPRSDIWAMGVIMYELVSGRMPFEGENLAKLILSALGEEPPTFASLGIDVPLAFQDIVQRCLCKSRDGRFASARELADALTALLEEPPPRVSVWQAFARRAARASGVVRVMRTPAPRAHGTLFGMLFLLAITLAVWSYALAIGPFARAPHTAAVAPALAGPARAHAEASSQPSAAEPHAPLPGALAPAQASPQPSAAGPRAAAAVPVSPPTAAARESPPRNEKRPQPATPSPSRATPSVSDFGGRR